MNYSWAENQSMSSFGTSPSCFTNSCLSCCFVALEQLLTELEDFLRLLDKENLSSTAIVKKSFLSDLLRVYTKSSGMGKEKGGWVVGVSWELLWSLEAASPWRLVGRGDMKIRRRK